MLLGIIIGLSIGGILWFLNRLPSGNADSVELDSARLASFIEVDRHSYE